MNDDTNSQQQPPRRPAGDSGGLLVACLLVLTGTLSGQDDHAYARSGLMTANDPEGAAPQQDVRSGTVYVVSVSGPKMYDLGWRPFMHRSAEGVQLYQIVTVDGRQLRYEARFATGVLYDAFSLEKQAAGPNRLVDRIPDLPEHRATRPERP